MPLYNAAPMAGTILEVGIFVLVGLPIAKYFDMLPLKRALGRYAKRQAYGLPHEDAATGLQMIAGFNRRLKESSEPNRAAS